MNTVTTPNRVVFFRILLGMALALTTYLTTTAVQYRAAESINDKLSHLLAFSALALLADFSFPRSPFHLNKAAPLLLYGCMIEVVQYHLPYRSFSLLDILADAAGLMLYWAAAVLLRKTAFGKPGRGWKPWP